MKSRQANTIFNFNLVPAPAKPTNYPSRLSPAFSSQKFSDMRKNRHTVYIKRKVGKDMAKRIEKICYQPGVFLTVEHNDLCTKLEVKSSVEELHLGEQTSERKMNFILEKKHGVFPNIKKLVIEPGAAEIFVDNEVFPNVKRVDSRNPQYLSCDRMLVRIKQGAVRSLRNVFDLASNMPVNLSMISEIERFALCQCMSTELINTGSLRCVSVNSFEGSAISDMSYDENGTKITGGILVDIDDNADCVSLPGRDANMITVASGIKFSNTKKIIINDVDFTIRTIIPSISGIPEMSETIVINDPEYKAFSEIQTLANLSGVKNIEFGEKCKWFQSIDGIAYTSSLAYLVACPSDRTKEVVIPEGVRTVLSSSFKNCSVTSVKFPDSVVNIEDKAFYSCKRLKHVDFGHGITHIGSKSSWNVFACCGLEEIDIPEQVTYIGSGAFWSCKLKKVTFHEGLREIAPDAFGGNVDLKEITIPDSVTHIGENAFRNTKVVHVHNYFSDIITAVGEPAVFAYMAGYTEIDINGKSVFVPKHMKEEGCRQVKKIIEIWIDGTADGTDKLFGYAITLNEKQDTAIKIYENTKSENAKKYLKRYSKSIARRYLAEDRKEELIKFIGFGLLPKQGLQEILDEAKDEAEVCAYVLQMMQKKRTTADRFKL